MAALMTERPNPQVAMMMVRSVASAELDALERKISGSVAGGVELQGEGKYEDSYWSVDHIISQYYGGQDHLSNYFLMPKVR